MSETQPLFVENKTELFSAIRISKLPRNSDSAEMMDDIIRRIRNGFYRKLGIDRVATLLTYSTSWSNPPTEQQILRSIARDTEIKWATAEVIRNLRSVYLETNSLIQQFNDENPYRYKTLEELNAELTLLIDEIENNLELLRGSESIGEESNLIVKTVSPDSRPYPGDTIWKSSSRQFTTP